MIKYYLKDNKQEVKVGDKITISVPTSTPYGQAKCVVNVVVTQESLKQLIKDGLVLSEEKSPFNLEDYKLFIRRLARKCNITFPEALELLDSIKSVSLYAHNTLLLEMIAEVFNKDKKIPYSVYVIGDNSILYVDLKNVHQPFFTTREDAQKAAYLMRPFYEEARKGKGKQED